MMSNAPSRIPGCSRIWAIVTPPIWLRRNDSARVSYDWRFGLHIQRTRILGIDIGAGPDRRAESTLNPCVVSVTCPKGVDNEKWERIFSEKFEGGKASHIRTVPVPDWVKSAVDADRHDHFRIARLTRSEPLAGVSEGVNRCALRVQNNRTFWVCPFESCNCGSASAIGRRMAPSWPGTPGVACQWRFDGRSYKRILPRRDTGACSRIRSNLAGTLFLLTRSPVNHQRQSHGSTGLLGRLEQEALTIGRDIIGDIAGRLVLSKSGLGGPMFRPSPRDSIGTAIILPSSAR
jgi:hypothetical protein